MARARPLRKDLLLCDLGNVLIRFDHRIAVRRILPFTPRTFRQVYLTFFDSPATRAYEEGRLNSRRFFARLKKDLALKGLTYGRFVPIWSDIFRPNPGMLPLLKALRRRCRLCLISNINALHYAHILRRFPEHLGVFDRVVLSCEVGAQKPHPRIYRAALADEDPRSGSPGPGPRGGRLLYVDDRADLVRAARRLHIPSLRFRGVAQLKKELRRRRLLP
ncbi:MAG: HAD family hydrolase [Deltaproteobacteria bacterium]